MVGDFAAGTAAGAGLPADLTAGAGLAADFDAGLDSVLRADCGADLAPAEVFRLLAGFLWFEAMGFFGGSGLPGVKRLGAAGTGGLGRVATQLGHPAPATRAAGAAKVRAGVHVDLEPGGAGGRKRDLGNDEELGQQLAMPLHRLGLRRAGGSRERDRGVEGFPETAGGAVRLDGLVHLGAHPQQLGHLGREGRVVPVTLPRQTGAPPCGQTLR